MFTKLKTILSKCDADYADLRYEIKKETVIGFNGKELTQIGSNSTDGFVLRVLIKGRALIHCFYEGERCGESDSDRPRKRCS